MAETSNSKRFHSFLDVAHHVVSFTRNKGLVKGFTAGLYAYKEIKEYVILAIFAAFSGSMRRNF